MEPGILRKARQQLGIRLAVFTTGLIFIFALQSSNQLRENASSEQQRHLQLVGLLAANRLSEITPNRPRSRGSIQTTGHAVMEAAGSREAEVRILWIGPLMNLLDDYGSFVPGGNLVPPEADRLQPQVLQLSNGAALWLPVHAPDTANGGRRLLGYVAVASSEAASSRTALISLVSATAASVVLALLGIPWILERSLQPLREQINRLHQFTGDVAHELRNPMMALQTSLANARERLQNDTPGSGKEPGAAMDSLKPLNQITARMASILNDLLLLTHLENGTGDVDEPSMNIDISDLFDELSVLHDNEARSKCVQLVFKVETPFHLTLVPSRALRILSNLITNAIRFSARGDTVQVTASVQGQSGVIRVDDEGPGIPKAQESRVFERLVQLDPDQNRSHRGLGLALSRSLVQLHGGSLDVQRSPAGGCRMQWTWPLNTTARRRWRLRPAGARR